jgi:type IV pili sensor histidine kinase/response regulator
MAVDETSRQVCFKHAVTPATTTPEATAVDCPEGIDRVDNPEVQQSTTPA